MPFQQPPVVPNIDQLISVLQKSGLAQKDQPLYQVIWTIIRFVQQGNVVIQQNSGGGGGGSFAPLTSTYLTETDETASLPNSRRLVAGTNVALDVSTPGQEIINVSFADQDYVVASDGGIPTPLPMDDGAGNFFYIPYTP